MRQFHSLCKVLILSMMVILSPSFAVAPVFVSDLGNAKLNLITSTKTATMVIQQMQQIQNQLKAIQYQAMNAKSFSGHNWDNAREALLQLGGAIQQGNALAYSASDIDQRFKQSFPGYANSQSATTNYSHQYQTWVQTNQDTMHGVMDQIHASYEQQSQEAALNQLLAQKAHSTQGRLQALQVGNEIAAEQVAQMQKLKATMMAQANAQAEYNAYQAQKDAAIQQSVDAVVKTSKVEYPRYRDQSKFGLLPSFGGRG